MSIRKWRSKLHLPCRRTTRVGTLTLASRRRKRPNSQVLWSRRRRRLRNSPFFNPRPKFQLLFPRSRSRLSLTRLNVPLTRRRRRQRGPHRPRARPPLQARRPAAPRVCPRACSPDRGSGYGLARRRLLQSIPRRRNEPKRFLRCNRTVQLPLRSQPLRILPPPLQTQSVPATSRRLPRQPPPPLR